MHRIFTVPELVIAILTEFSQTHRLAYGPLTVCKNWADITMDLIWREVCDPSLIFDLLAPVGDLLMPVGEQSEGDDGTYEFEFSFESLPTPSGWARFDIYRRRIHVLDNMILCATYRHVINDVAVLRPDAIPFLPNLTELAWSCPNGDLWRESVFFMHEGITKLTLKLREVETYGTILQYFEHIASRMSRLQSFALDFSDRGVNASQARIGPALAWLLPKLRFLKTLILSPSTDLYTVICSTASLPNLETIDIHIEPHMSKSSFIISSPTSPITLSSKLQSLTLAIPYPDATTHIFCTEFAVMTKLSLQSHKPESQISTRKLTMAISLRCKSLRDISLLSNALHLTGDKLDLSPDERITLADIQPLFGCRNVIRFSIDHPCPLQLTNSDIRHILQNWEMLSELSLNPSPIYLSPSDVSHTYSDWETLAFVVEHGRNLEGLGLYLNGYAKVPPHTGMPPLPKLKKLSVGTSKLPSKMRDVLGPVMFLSRFLTLQCWFHYSYECPDRAGWDILGDLPDSFIQVRMEERELARTRVC
ncbi:uncharacterized protein EV420DRAFT_498637 [Desarmillaria tabescens]|uniref:F-box domain-containing protein n=1 Tax=Armillaria tabescens TaxID=1929756 RepID=A0AA39KAC0_ARMTA|nr:uncharacterized protein EV420DRAFT_498637 [Desarmillaria tabescens]KAK0457499.1 hypothetical protein EV420DRAFT_498637 [Desarmillaria tabescens]